MSGLKKIVFLAAVAVAVAFVANPGQNNMPARGGLELKMGMFDFLGNAFKNEAFDDRRAKASHILVKSEDQCNEVKEKIAGGLSFANAAREFSTCPSGKSGGSLGSFEPGKMVKQFDEVCFDENVPVGDVTGPVKTQFGYHLILVEDRFVNTVRSDGSSAF